VIDTLGDRIKFYESQGLPDRFLPLLPVVIRLDGVAFHTFTKGLSRPYDKRLSDLMIETTKFLVKETNARCGYTQSDEITLVLFSDTHESQIYFDGRVQKILSVLPARASVFFNEKLTSYLPEKAGVSPVFDCRAFTVPNKTEAVNTLIWREKDATRNSVSMAAQAYYSHKELDKKSSSDKQELLFKKGINWNDYPAFFKRGTYVQRKLIDRPFSSIELATLPDKHEAKTNPELVIKRTDYVVLEMPPILKVMNKVEVVFDGATPLSTLFRDKEFQVSNSQS
jgi:tRNA(His) 5'-end guanylyltransferase